MKTILVTGAGGIIGYGILKSIRISNYECKLIGVSCYADSVALAFCDLFIKAPKISDDNYIEWLLKVIDDYDVDLVIPGFEDEIKVWQTNIIKLKQSRAKLVFNNINLISLCYNKWNFYLELNRENCPHVIPTSISSNFEELFHEFGLPLFMKPKVGTASKGIIKIFDKEIFDTHKDKIGDELIVQPLIGKDDEEFTTSAFCDGQGGYFAIMTLRRKLSKTGFTEKAEVHEDKNIEKAVSNLCKILKPVGPTNFQFRIDKGVYKILEINPRISSATSIRSLFGYNESLMCIEYFLYGILPTQPDIRKGNAVRYVEDYIVYK